jgi:hypothetical protein
MTNHGNYSQQNTNGLPLDFNPSSTAAQQNPTPKMLVFKESCFVCSSENVNLFVSRYLHHKLSDATSWHSDDIQAINQPAM